MLEGWRVLEGERGKDLKQVHLLRSIPVTYPKEIYRIASSFSFSGLKKNSHLCRWELEQKVEEIGHSSETTS